jgi:hypothetical protein
VKLVVHGLDGVQVNYMFLPTFIGFNAVVKTEIETKLVEKFAGQTMTPSLLEKMHRWVLAYLCERFPIPGLQAYLEAIRHVDDGGSP